jgi:hypothetical protein
MRYLKTFLLFEDLNQEDSQLSKRTLKNKLWHERNPDPVGTIIEDVSELKKFGIPDSIIEHMKGWDIIYKSPYSKSFYSSSDISWTNKPDGSFRVSDHWNFTTNRSERIHCKTTEPVKNNTHYSIGQYDESIDKYVILISEMTEGEVDRIKNKEQLLKHLKDPETIYKKKLFKEKVLAGEITTEFQVGDEIISGQVDKYTGNDMRVKDNSDKVIFTSNKFNPKWIKIYNKSGEEIEDPFALG